MDRRKMLKLLGLAPAAIILPRRLLKAASPEEVSPRVLLASPDEKSARRYFWKTATYGFRYEMSQDDFRREIRRQIEE